MTRKQREALEDIEIEASIQRTNEECDAEIGARTGRFSCAQPNLSNVSDIDRQMLALPKSHPARFMHFYGRPTVSRTFATLAEAQRLLWQISNPFAGDLMACAETNS